MNIVSGTAPFQRKTRETKHIMRELLIGLAVIFVAAVVYNFFLGINYGFKTIGIMVVSILFTLISDIIAGSLRYSKEKHGNFGEYIVSFVKDNFSIVTGVIFALTVPIGTPVYVVIIGSMFATLIAKHVFGGFGHNIFNPAAMGRIFLALAFGGQLKAYLPGGENLGGLTAGATVTGVFSGNGAGKFIIGALPSNVSLLDLWIGNHSGALGETFTLLILIVGVVLAAREVINWRTPVFMLGTVAVSSLFLGLIGGVNVFEYMLLQLGLGGLMFGAIFMFTDPVTAPTSNFGKALIGIFAGFFNVLIRIAGGYPEGTAFSIALVNVISPMIDRFITGRTDTKLWKPYTASGISFVLSVGILSWVGAAKMPSVEPGPIEPDEPEVHVTYLGKFDSAAPATEYSGTFTTNVEVGLDVNYHIVKLEYDVIANPENYADAEIDAVVDYYTSISVSEFKSLEAPKLSGGTTGTTVVGQTGEHIIPNKIFTSFALYSAIDDALKNIDVYQGEHGPDSPSDYYNGEPLTVKVDVYVDKVENKIKVVDVLEGEHSEGYQNWDEKGEEVLELYHDVDVTTFLAYTSEIEMIPSDKLSGFAGVTWSRGHIFAAVQAALVGYGG